MPPIVGNGTSNDWAASPGEYDYWDCVNGDCPDCDVTTEDEDVDDAKMRDLLDWLLMQSSETLESLKHHTLVVHPGTMVLTSDDREEIETMCQNFQDDCFLVISKVK